MSSEPRYATLQDYIQVLRRQRLPIGAITAAGVLVALALALAAQPAYESTASLSFSDPLEAIDLFSGDDSAPEITPAQRAILNADLITRRAVVGRVADSLETDLSRAEIEAAISTQVDVQTSLVRLTGTWDDPQFAARLANAFAVAARLVAERDFKERLADAEALLEGQLRQARKDLPQSTFQVGILANQLQRVETLRRIAEPVRIEDRAEPPDDPVSPNPTRDAILGGFVGVLLGLLAAFVRDALDRRVRSAHDASAELMRPVVGRIGLTAFGHQGLIANGQRPMRTQDFEAFRLLRTNLACLHPGGPRTVLVTSAAPEEGKTTTSIALASAAAIAGQRVLLVETDLRRPCFAERLKIRAAPGLTDYLSGQAPPKDILAVVDLNDPPTENGAPRKRQGPAQSLVCIAAGTQVATAAEMLDGQRFQAFFDKVVRAYDLVVLDTSPLLAVADPLKLAALVDAVLVCIRVDRTTREQVRATREALRPFAEETTGAVVTGLTRNNPDVYGYHDYY